MEKTAKEIRWLVNSRSPRFEEANASYAGRNSSVRCSNSEPVSVAAALENSSRETTSCRVLALLDTGSVPSAGGFEQFVDEYGRQIGIRDEFIWKWTQNLLPTFQLSCVPAEYEDVATDIKLALTMYVATVDDIAEYHRDKVTFEQARNVPFPINERPRRPTSMTNGR